jgi:hypothetical protein
MMASGIDVTKPVFSNPTTASVRANFATAKSEIEALQELARPVGFADYNDYATGIAAASITSSTWTKLTNDGLGPYTLTAALPDGVDRLWNASAGQFDFTDLPIYSMVDIRADLSITTTAANQVVRLRMDMAIGHASAFDIEPTQAQFKTTGTYHYVTNIPFYIGSAPIAANPAELKIWTDASATVRVNGWYIRARLGNGA